MAFKAVLVVCALLADSAFSQCLGPAIAGLASPFGLAGPGLGLGPVLGPTAYGSCGNGVASTGGGFPVTSASPIAPTGVSVVSENAIEGALSVEGNLPLLGSVSLEGAFPTAGAGAVSYGCGNGAIGINTESPIATGILTPGAVGPAPGLTGLGVGGLGFGTAGLGIGANGLGLGAGAINGLGYNGLGLGIGGPCGATY